MGPDKISPKILKHCAGSLSGPVAALLSKSLETCAKWKLHRIILVPKSGSSSKITSYRPISLLSNLSKVMETVLYNKIIDFVRPMITNCQFGFLSNRSSITQLLACYSKVIQALDEKHSMDILYLDITLTLSHITILYKIWRIGITGKLWNWLKAYLDGRKHCVYFQGSQSASLSVISGVPQGSVLGPLLFLIYVNDIPAAINYSSTYLFADNAKLLKVIKSTYDVSGLQEDLSSLDDWSSEWLLNLNVLKCSHLTFSLAGRTQTGAYTTNGCEIAGASSYKDLGIRVSQNLSWSDHIQLLCSKAYGSLHIIK